MGFDVLYFTPIHPIGITNRKGRNNALKAAPGDPGSFYAIGSAAGGHTAVHPELGTLDDFRALVEACKQHQIGNRARRRRAMLARSSLAARASGVVQAPPRRFDALCGEPAEEVRGHRQSRFQLRRRRLALECVARRHPVLGRSRACASSASTTRTPSRSISGSG